MGILLEVLQTVSGWIGGLAAGWLFAQFARDNRDARLERLPWFHRVWAAPIFAIDRWFDKRFGGEKADRARREFGYLTRGLRHDSLWDKARKWLEELETITRHEIERHQDGKPTYADLYHPDDPETKWLHGEVFLVHPRRSAAKMWLRLAAAKSSRGYRSVEVLQEPPPTHAAIIAALTVLEIGEESSQELRERLPTLGKALDDLTRILDELEIQQGKLETHSEELETAPDCENPDPEEFAKTCDELEAHMRELTKDAARLAAAAKIELARYRGKGVEYLEELLRFYRPGFDALSNGERYALVGRALGYTNTLLSAQRNLLRFLEYGEANKDLRVPMEKVTRDVQAAVLADVEDLSPTAIGELLDIPPSKSDAIKGGHSTVSKMMKRGKAILVEAWGPEGWTAQAKILAASAADNKAETNGLDVPGYNDALRRLVRLSEKGPSAAEAARLVDWDAFFPEDLSNAKEERRSEDSPKSA